MDSSNRFSFQRKSGDQIGWGIIISGALHLMLVAVIVLWPAWSPSKQLRLAGSYQVSLVSAPLIQTQAMATAPARPRIRRKARVKIRTRKIRRIKKVRRKPKRHIIRPKRRPPKVAEAIATKKTREARRRAELLRKRRLARLRAERRLQRRLRRLMQERREQLREQNRLDQRLASIKRRVSGRATSRTAGLGAPGGGGDARMSLRWQIYYAQLLQRLHKSWVVPEAFIKGRGDLLAVVIMRLRRDGRLDKVWLEKSSGNRRYDTSTLEAVRRASPYSPLPTGYHSRYHEVGVNFRPEGVAAH